MHSWHRYLCMACALLVFWATVGCAQGTENMSYTEIDSTVIETSQPSETPPLEPEPEETAVPEPERKPELSDYSLEALEASMIEYTNAAAYVDGAQGEYIRRMSEDSVDMAKHLESLPLSTLAYLFNSISSYCYRPTHDNIGAEAESVNSFISTCESEVVSLLAEYMVYQAGASGQGKHTSPPASGIICEAFIPEKVPSIDFVIDYVSDSTMIFHSHIGLLVYDFDSAKIVYSADLQTALGSTVTQGSSCVSVKVTSDGNQILLFWSENGVPSENCYSINCDGWSYTYGSYEQIVSKLKNRFFEYDMETHGYLLCGIDGSGQSLWETVYVLGDIVTPLF